MKRSRGGLIQYKSKSSIEVVCQQALGRCESRGSYHQVYAVSAE